MTSIPWALVTLLGGRIASAGGLREPPCAALHPCADHQLRHPRGTPAPPSSRASTDPRGSEAGRCPPPLTQPHVQARAIYPEAQGHLLWVVYDLFPSWYARVRPFGPYVAVLGPNLRAKLTRCVAPLAAGRTSACTAQPRRCCSSYTCGRPGASIATCRRCAPTPEAIDFGSTGCTLGSHPYNCICGQLLRVAT